MRYASGKRIHRVALWGSAMPGRYFTIKEAAERLAISHDTVSRLISRGELPAIRVSERLYRIPAPALERYESGVPIAVRRVVRKRAAEGVRFGAGEEEPETEATPARARDVHAAVRVGTA
jgi:excisionase family DNA binding protein